MTKPPITNYCSLLTVSGPSSVLSLKSSVPLIAEAADGKARCSHTCFGPQTAYKKRHSAYHSLWFRNKLL